MPPPLIAGWTPWTLLPLSLSPSILAETLDGGQAFRWQRLPDGTWLGQWSDCVVRLATTANLISWSAPTPLAPQVAAALPAYLGLDRDFEALVDALPWRSDAHLASCLQAFPGLRLLRQPFGETLLGFLCSAAKQIVQIKQMVALLAERFGAPLPIGLSSPVTLHSSRPFHRLPTWSELASVSETELRTCQLGFRARHIAGTSAYLAARPGWLEETASLPYAAAKTRLCTLPGVGEKVADCVLLFGAGRLEAFPVDVWIVKTMADRYALANWTPAQIAHFGRTHFGPAAGLAQQYLFSYERHPPKTHA